MLKAAHIPPFFQKLRVAHRQGIGGAASMYLPYNPQERAQLRAYRAASTDLIVWSAPTQPRMVTPLPPAVDVLPLGPVVAPHKPQPAAARLRVHFAPLPDVAALRLAHGRAATAIKPAPAPRRPTALGYVAAARSACCRLLRGCAGYCTKLSIRAYRIVLAFFKHIRHA